MSDILKQIYIELCSNENENLVQNIKNIYEEENKSRRQTVFQYTDTDIQWKNMTKYDKFNIIKLYMKNKKIKGTIKDYTFKNIKYNTNTKSIVSITMIPN